MLRAAAPTVVIHCAALADTRACHDDPARAFAVNAAGALHVARACADIDALMVLVSTDAVFDGRMRAKPYTEDDIPHSPVGVYGTTKLAAEHLIARTCRTLIARTGWLFCDDPLRDRKLLGVLVRRVEAGQRVEVVTDKWGLPPSPRTWPPRSSITQRPAWRACGTSSTGESSPGTSSPGTCSRALAIPRWNRRRSGHFRTGWHDPITPPWRVSTMMPRCRTGDRRWTSWFAVSGSERPTRHRRCRRNRRLVGELSTPLASMEP
ncbi:MAG: dTDP-4-dehydrorhamnose reductase [Actinomycetota bacterium]|nr:dTDP-4-dehydrorhamnose reductase [Actinomycetota bacterium]